ncbi:MAG: TIGR01212 family radical SAM protein, partial [Pseudomonadota bacterium]|nr:TIGR01212 family radical SAM protein [Pseudomonadota bacterium]
MKRGGCIYCNAAGSGTGAMSRGVDLRGQIETQMKVMSRRYGARAFIAYFQSYSNTYADLPTLQANFDAVLPYPEIVGIAVGTRPDCIDRDRLGLISSYAPQRLVWMEYGL